MHGELYHGLTAVIYARFSCSKQREASIEDQVRECQSFATREGIQVIRTYSDHARSGKTDDRPAFREMISNAGESDLVLVYMMDRFSRDQYDAPVYKQELKRKGVRLVSAMEYIGDSPESVIYEKLLEGLAACESAKTSMRAKRGMHGNALKCHHNGVRVFGYDSLADGTYAVNPSEAAYVVEAFERKAKGEPVNAIAADFAKRGVTTYYGNPCSRTMVANMLSNDKYRGVYSFGSVTVPDGMPRIVSDDLFNTARRTRVKKCRAREYVRSYPLAGKAICAECGSTMQGLSCRNRYGTRYEYYGCKDRCIRNVRADWMEESIVDAIRTSLRDRAEAERIATLIRESMSNDRQDAKLAAAEKAKADAERALANIQSAIEQGVIPPRCNERIKELQEQSRHAELRIASIRTSMESFEVSDMADFLQLGSTLDEETILGAFVHSVIVDRDCIVAVLNYGNEKGEPFLIEKVRLDNVWLPSRAAAITFGYFMGKVLMRLGRSR